MQAPWPPQCHDTLTEPCVAYLACQVTSCEISHGQCRISVLSSVHSYSQQVAHNLCMNQDAILGSPSGLRNQPAPLRWRQCCWADTSSNVSPTAPGRGAAAPLLFQRNLVGARAVLGMGRGVGRPARLPDREGGRGGMRLVGPVWATRPPWLCACN